MSAPKAELARLVRRLRRRAELSAEGDWAASAPRTFDQGPVRSFAPAAGGPAARLESLASEIAACRACPLGASRLNAVPGVGDPRARVMFVGEGPGFDEDRKGEPFVGRSGQLLDKIMEAIGLSRKTVFIANIVKCHPMTDPLSPEKRGNDRPPTPAEIAACRGWLDAQIRAVRPKVIVTLGAVATRVLLADETPISRLRGRWRAYDAGEGLSVRLLPTFHPAALLRNPDLKRDVWTDMKTLRQELSQP